MKPDMFNHMFDFLKEFMLCNSWIGVVPEQARAIFTALCLMGDIRADTSGCDNLLWELYRDCAMEDTEMSYDEFENFMVGLIVQEGKT